MPCLIGRMFPAVAIFCEISFPRSSANYLTVIYHRDIGFPFTPAYRHVTRFSRY
jgi:hypothetical protein